MDGVTPGGRRFDGRILRVRDVGSLETNRFWSILKYEENGQSVQKASCAVAKGS
jgi:hypothetical protein